MAQTAGKLHRRAARRGRARRIARGFRWAFRALCALALAAAVAVAGAAAYAWNRAGLDFKSIPALHDPSRAPLPQAVKAYSADGVLLGRIAAQERVVVGPRQISAAAKNAVVAIEDQRFYEHPGVDLQGLARAAWADLQSGSAGQGASTIEMQYVRNVYLNFAKTANRKIQEAALALQLSSQWSKRRILAAYLNTVYFGEGSYGIEAAARHYFGVHASRLSVAQASLLAGLIQSPSGLDPRRNPAGARARQARVLDEMFAQGYITGTQAARAKRAPWHLRRLTAAQRIAEPALFNLVLSEARRALGARRVRRGGLILRATFRMPDIRAARARLAEAYPELPADQRPAVAAAFTDPRTGRIRVLASTRPGQFDLASQAQRQPGSVVKAFTAAQLISAGGQLSDPVSNEPLDVKDGRSSYTLQPTRPGIASVQDALRWSQNPAFWRLYEQAGPRRVLALERRLGLTGMDANPAAALGGVRTGTSPLEIAGAFGAFAADGRLRRPHALQSASDLLGNRLWSDRRLAAGRRVLHAEHVRLLNVGLQAVVKDGFPQLADSLTIARDRPLAGKTGTTNNHADAWFAGYTPQLAGAVWTGYANSNRPLDGLPGQDVWGSTIPAQAFDRVAHQLADGTPVREFPKPSGVQIIPARRGMRVQQAMKLLAQFRFSGAYSTPLFSRRARPGTILSVSPPGGSWTRTATPVRVTYATDERPAPQLAGRSYLDALDVLGRFARIRARMRPSDEPAGTVLSQDPAPGMPLKAGSVIRVTVSSSRAPAKVIERTVHDPADQEEIARLKEQAGASALKVPDLAGVDVQAARQVLQSLGFSVTVSGYGQSVTGQDPGAGQPAEPGQNVTLQAQ